MRIDYSDTPDDELWRRARDHDGPAFGELFERHATAVYNHCFRRTASWSTAQDLTSIVFLEGWRRRKDVRLHGGSSLPWLLAVANNAVRNTNRSIRRHQRLFGAMQAATPSQVGFEEGVDQRVDDEAVMASILEKINSLRIEEREIISLCDWAGLTYAEAAIALALPIGTVRSRLSRAREHLRSLTGDVTAQRQRGQLAATLESPKENDGSL